MTPGDPEAFELFDQLMDLPPEERLRALDSCSIDDASRSQVRRMLELAESPPSGFTQPALRRVITGAATERRPDRIAGYTVEDVIGAGGMGVVYRARQSRPDRPVAIKLMRQAIGTPEAALRFAHEAEYLGRLQHPGIAQIIEAGAEGEGADARAFIAMELVEGDPLDEYSRKAGLGRTERLQLLARVAEAVHHAHLRGVIHRDLKPSNILVTADGQPKVIDFGVARVVERDGQATLQTAAGQLVGTLAYMSPEQVGGYAEEIDLRIDVYALGVIAYELLGGRLPLDLGTASLVEAARIVREENPVRLGRIESGCRGDVEWIVARALEKDPDDRYQSAAALQRDIENFLAGDPIEARPLTALETLARLARRHKAVVLGFTSTLLAIVIGAGFAVRFSIKNARLAALEKSAREEATANEQEALRLAELAERRAADVATVSDFVSGQIGAVEPRSLGSQIRIAMSEELRRALNDPGVGAEPRSEDVERLEGLLDQAHMTTVATKTLDRAFFDPMRAEITQRFADRPELHLRLLLAHSELLINQSRLERAIEALEAAVEVASELPLETPETLQASLLLAQQWTLAARFDEAEALVEQCFERAEGVLPPSDRRLVGALGDLARAAEARGDLERAESLFREQLAGRIQDPNGTYAERRDAVHAMNDLGVLLMRNDGAEEAFELSERAATLVRPGRPPRDLHRADLARAARFGPGEPEPPRGGERRMAPGDRPFPPALR